MAQEPLPDTTREESAGYGQSTSTAATGRTVHFAGDGRPVRERKGRVRFGKAYCTPYKGSKSLGDVQRRALDCYILAPTCAGAAALAGVSPMTVSRLVNSPAGRKYLAKARAAHAATIRAQALADSLAEDTPLEPS